MGAARLPRHRRTASVTSLESRPEADAVGIAQILEGKLGLGQAQLLALIEADRAAQSRKQRDRKLCDARLLFLRFGKAADMALDVVVRKSPADPAVDHVVLEVADATAEVCRREIGAQKVEGIAHMQLVAAACIGGHSLQRAGAVAHFADRRAVLVSIEQCPEALQEADILRLCLVVEMVLHPVRVALGGIEPARRDKRRRIVPQFLVAEIVVHRIQAEAVHATVEPESHGRKHCVLNLGMVKIQVRLRGQEVVLVILPAHAVPFPARPAEDRQPVVRRRAVRLRICPDVPIRLRIVTACPALHEPGMPIRGVRNDLIDDDLEPQLVRCRHHLAEIGKRAENRIDIAIIGDVIAHIGHRRSEERRQPDRIDSERGNVRQASGNPLYVAEPVGIRVLKRPRVDLIDYRPAPPIGLRRFIRRFHQAASISHKASQFAYSDAGGKPQSVAGPNATGERVNSRYQF
ncbi:hypothetical protein RHSP_50349 [Rhizobium freirei PRF 81]|uniref:Uncharacterized protein n=1 Tax=Rhizobium freirei PRF 81 TaxID=363754 RepID=N6VAB0_9HYPH|nr:hypothetical protein RHSP_50349 [Rhizobium freirei PRF 81]